MAEQLFQSAVVYQIRTSKMKKMHNLNIQTGIYKMPRTEPVWVGPEGLSEDESDRTFHGGPEKAIHQYPPSSYNYWIAAYPLSAHLFTPGAFGENLVTYPPQDSPSSPEMNENTLCIGDKIAFGPEVILQVCLPRQPCFKLNHRFGIKNFLGQVKETRRTGWYFRVLRQGWLEVGHRVQIITRGKITIREVQEALYGEAGKDATVLKKMIDDAAMGEECRKQFKAKLETLLAGQKTKNKEVWSDYVVAKKVMETKNIVNLVLERPLRGKQEEKGKDIKPGSFVRLKLPNGLLRSYSIVSGTPSRIHLSILKSPTSLGGSTYIHTSLHASSTLQLGSITPSVPVSSSASHHIFIAGGIGITAFLSHLQMYDRINFDFVLHYAVQSRANMGFRKTLATYGDRVKIYAKEDGERMDMRRLFSGRPWNSMLYVCGPASMLAMASALATSLQLGADELHVEAFQAERGGDAFEMEVRNGGKAGGREMGKGKSRGKVIRVGEDETMLEGMRREGFQVESSCEVGNCGSCKVMVTEGRVVQRGSGLLGEERAEGWVLSCVERGVGRIAVDW